MDLSSYTPIYVRTTGNDENDGWTVENAKRNPQSAYDDAFAAGGLRGHVLDIGAGTFAGITLTANWPVRIAVRGAGATSSFLGGINGQGSAESTDPSIVEAGLGYDIALRSDLTVNLGTINASAGASVDYSGARGGDITLTDAITGNVSSNGGYAGSSAGGTQNIVGGNIYIEGSTCGDISAYGGENYSYTAGNGGSVTLVDSVVGNINASGGTSDNDNAGHGGDVSITNSLAGTVVTVGGTAPSGNIYEGCYGGHGGNVSLLNSDSGSINAQGGIGGYATGASGTVSIYSSGCGAIEVSGGASTWGWPSGGGDVTLENSSSGNISSNGSGSNSSEGSNGGSVSLTSSASGYITAYGGNSSGRDGGTGGNGGNVTLEFSLCSYIGTTGGDSWVGSPGNGGDVVLVDLGLSYVSTIHTEGGPSLDIDGNPAGSGQSGAIYSYSNRYTDFPSWLSAATFDDTNTFALSSATVKSRLPNTDSAKVVFPFADILCTGL
jgi:hypothetical protein